MCGIVGYVGKSDRTVHVLLRGLERLEYRGYDSAGIAVLKDHHVDVVKKSGKLDCLKACVDPEWKTEIGIGHTRWATHGSANQENAHLQCIMGSLKIWMRSKKSFRKQTLCFVLIRIQKYW